MKFRGIVPALIILLALGFIIYRLNYKVAPHSREGLYRLIGTKLGETFSNYLPEKGKVFVFTSGSDDFYIEGLKKGLSAKKITVKPISTSQVKTESESDYEDKLLEFYNQQLIENSDVAGIIFLNIFPQKVEQLDIFSEGNSPKIALLAGMSPKLSGLIRQGYVQVVVAGTPEVHTVEKGERIPAERIFKERFMIVRQDNLEEIIKEYPRYSLERR